MLGTHWAKVVPRLCQSSIFRFSLSLTNWHYSSMPHLPDAPSAHSRQRHLPSKPYFPTFINNVKFNLRLGKWRLPHHRLHAIGFETYAICSEYPNFAEYREALGMPDSYQAFFDLTFLHMWFVALRMRYEGQEGQAVRDFLFKALEVDMTERKKTLKQLRIHMFESFLAYDHGFLSGNDQLLASALWEKFYHNDPNVDLTQLSLLVRYFHKQVKHVMNLPNNVFFPVSRSHEDHLTFLPLMEDTFSAKYAQKRLKIALRL